MPTHTPSPHRFLAPHPPSTQKPKPKPPSALRNGYPAYSPKPTFSSRPLGISGTQTQRVTPGKRFVLDGSRDKQVGGGESEAWHPQSSTPPTKPARKLQRVESIDEASESSQNTTLADQDGDSIMRSVENLGPIEDEGDENEDTEEEEMLFETYERNKRRRITPQPPSPPPHSTPRVARPEPETPRPPSTSSHRFRVPAPKTPAPFTASATTTAPPSTTTTTTPAPNPRPHFIIPRHPPSPSKAAPAAPLTEIFSPSRKSQKYVPDGMASTLQAWIVETASTGYAAQNTGVVYGREREEGVKLRVRVGGVGQGRAEVECFAGGVVFVDGEVEGGLRGQDAGVRVLLAGKGGARGAVRVAEGKVVGIRAPVWDVDVQGEKWVVGVDWVIL